MTLDNWQQAMGRVRANLRRIGLTQTEVAAKMGVNPSNLSQWLNGHVEPKLGGFLALLDAAGMTLTDVERDDVPVRAEKHRIQASRDTLRDLLAQWIGDQVLEERLEVRSTSTGEREAHILARVVELFGAEGPESVEALEPVEERHVLVK